MPRYNRTRHYPPPSPKVQSPPKTPVKSPAQSQSYQEGESFEGIASFYGPGFHGNLTANGEAYDQHALTCAHPTLPFGTLLRITYLETGLSVVVRVNDRGPFVEGRIIDLSIEAARRIGMYADGTGRVHVTIISLGNE